MGILKLCKTLSLKTKAPERKACATTIQYLDKYDGKTTK